MNVGIVILAAGASSRMGAPKQLLQIDGRSLIKRIAETAMDAPCYPIVVVLGANREMIRKELTDMPITIIDNPQWEKGMSGSIKMGLAGAYMTFKDLESIIFLTADMPLVSVDLIKRLISKAEQVSEKINDVPDIVACSYGGQMGIPVLFRRNLFNDLLELSGDNGAKKVILANKVRTVTVEFPEGRIDLDTLEEYRSFLSNFNQN
jgi:molybdenum cofactor cytidylyltransferase